MRFGVSRYQPSVKSSAQAELSPREEAIPVQGQNETNSTSDIGYLTLGVTSGANAIPLVGAEIVIEQRGALINQIMPFKAYIHVNRCIRKLRSPRNQRHFKIRRN